MTDSSSLQRSAEVEDLTYLTGQYKKKMHEDVDTGKSSLHRSEEIEDLAHLSPQDINKPLFNDRNITIKHN
ncbi:unnamed protein product [Rotaria magnacalcarata]|uniref:Uncharacterized protein n=1 Tax=Rotaria magnacalcarata TaxID=392030 RepID=A0A8S2P3Z7_9BILA|nr:unnamed protein product [Rotaria magnacalcarata]